MYVINGYLSVRAHHTRCAEKSVFFFLSARELRSACTSAPFLHNFALSNPPYVSIRNIRTLLSHACWQYILIQSDLVDSAVPNDQRIDGQGDSFAASCRRWQSEYREL